MGFVAMKRNLDILAFSPQPPGPDQLKTTKVLQDRLIAYGSGSSVVIQDVRTDIECHGCLTGLFEFS